MRYVISILALLVFVTGTYAVPGKDNTETITKWMAVFMNDKKMGNMK